MLTPLRERGLSASKGTGERGRPKVATSLGPPRSQRGLSAKATASSSFLAQTLAHPQTPPP